MEELLILDFLIKQLLFSGLLATRLVGYLSLHIRGRGNTYVQKCSFLDARPILTSNNNNKARVKISVILRSGLMQQFILT